MVARGDIPFAEIAEAAAARARDIVAGWLPQGRLTAGRWHTLNPTRADGTTGSFSIQVEGPEAGMFADFAVAEFKGGDLIELGAKLFGWDRVQAAREVARLVGHPFGDAVNGHHAATAPKPRPAAPAKKAAPAVVPLSPIPADVPDQIPRGVVAGKLRFERPPDAVWWYRLPSGERHGAICRWDYEGGKECRPWICYQQADGKYKWALKGFAEPRPLYNADRIAAHPDALVVVVEGEKTCDAAEADGWIASTWAGGTSAVEKTDWSLLAGRTVVIWPDADDPGMRAAGQIYEILTGLHARVQIVALPDSLPQGWDLADNLQDKRIPIETVRAILESAAAMASGTPAQARDPDTLIDEPAQTEGEPLPPRKQEPPDNGSGINLDRQLVVIGHDGTGQSFFILSKASDVVHEISRSSICKKEGLQNLVPDHHFWNSVYPLGHKGVDWDAAGCDLMKTAYERGVYDPTKIRGRGVWIDNGRVVFNTGAGLYMGGHQYRVSDLVSKFYYIRAPSIEVPLVPAATDTEAQTLAHICRTLPWDEPYMGDLLAGYLMTAPICGALNWRSHIWVSGNRGAGKSWLITEIFQNVFGKIAIYPIGPSTAPGIRRALQFDCLPVVYDEAEGGKLTGMMRREQLLELMRISSSHSELGRVFQAGGGQSENFVARSAFCLASISPANMNAADESRTVVLSLKGENPDDPALNQDIAKRRKIIAHHLSLLPTDFGARLIRRNIDLVPVIRDNFATLITPLAKALGSTRYAYQIGTLIAGKYAMLSDQRISDVQAQQYVDSQDWSKLGEKRAVREESSLLDSFLATTTRVLTNDGHTVERTLRQLCKAVLRPSDDNLRPGEVEMKLCQFGIVEYPGGFAIANHTPAAQKIMERVEYGESYARLLARHPMSRKIRTPVKFGDMGPRAAQFFPTQAVLPD